MDFIKLDLCADVSRLLEKEKEILIAKRRKKVQLDESFSYKACAFTYDKSICHKYVTG